MAKCKNCGKWGLFLKLSANGMCESCEMALAIQNRANTNKNIRTVPQADITSSAFPHSNHNFFKRFSDSSILQLLRKYTPESIEYQLVTNLHYKPINSAHIPKDELYSRLDSVVMNRLYKVSSNKTWIRDAVKPDVFFSNYDELMFVLSELIEFEGCFPFYKPTPSEMKQEYTFSRNELTNNFIYRWWDSVLNQASGLKTIKGKQNKIDKCKNELLLYKNYLSEDNLKLLDELTSAVIDLENLERKDKGVKPFDEAEEKQILNELYSCKTITDRHFALMKAYEFYYKFRDTDRKYLEKCIELSLEDIGLLEQMNSEYKKSERDRVCVLQQHTNRLCQTDKLHLQDVEKHGFRGEIPAWKRLCIIYEKDNQLDKALEYCEKAINYYTDHGMMTTADDFKKRKERLEQKMNKKALSK